MSTQTIKTLGDEYLKEQARVRDLLGIYQSIGPAGKLGAVLIEHVLQRADQAAVSGDVVAMLRSYEEMKGCTE